MALKYGFLKCKIVSETTLKSTKRRNEIQYHLHADCSAASQNGDEIWDAAINRLGNPVSESHEIVDSDDGTLASRVTERLSRAR